VVDMMPATKQHRIYARVRVLKLKDELQDLALDLYIDEGENTEVFNFVAGYVNELNRHLFRHGIRPVKRLSYACGCQAAIYDLRRLGSNL
jgi:hypothetical protein